MARFSFASLRVRLLCLVLVALVPVLGLLFYTAAEQRRLSALEARTNALRLVWSASMNQSRLTEGARQLLVALAQLRAIQQQNTTECGRLFSKLLQQYPLYANLGVLDAKGNAICSALPLKQPINAADRTYFQRTLQTRNFSIGDYQIGRVTQKATLNFGYPVLDEANQVQAVVFAALDLTWLNQLVEQVQLPPQSSLVVIDKNGTILSRYPDPEQWIGQVLPDAPLVKTILSQTEGTAEIVGLDGVMRLYAFTSLGAAAKGGGRAYISIGIPQEVALREAEQLLVRNLTALGIVALLALLAAWFGSNWFVLRHVKALVTTAQQLSLGNLSARTGLSYGTGELNQLARTFDEMAATLEHREAQLKEAEIKYRTLVEQVPAVIYTAKLDLVGSNLYISPQVERLLGFSLQEWTENPQLWSQQLHPRDRDRVLNESALSREAHQPFLLEYRLLTKAGRVVWIRDEAKVMSDRMGRPCFVQGVMLDITDRKAADEALRARANELAKITEVLAKRNQELDQFAYVISHDLKAPLRAIANLSEWLEEDLEDKLTPNTQRQMSLLRGRVHRMEGLIDGLLQYSRIGRVNTQLETVAIDAMLHEIIDSLGPPSTFTIEVGSGMPQLTTERLRLEQVFANLISNAIKHHDRSDGLIKITAEDQGEFYEFTVEDDGPGIAPEYHEKVFVIFQTLQARDKLESTGIGLSLVKKIVEGQGGKISLHSQAGSGACFRFTWPKHLTATG